MDKTKNDIKQTDIQGLEEAAKPLLEFLKKTKHPHTVAVVTHNRIQLVDGSQRFDVDDFLK